MERGEGGRRRMNVRLKEMQEKSRGGKGRYKVDANLISVTPCIKIHFLVSAIYKRCVNCVNKKNYKA